jgi:hypothetical protein
MEKCRRTSAVVVAAVANVVFKSINTILDIVSNLSHLLHPYLNLPAVFIFLRKVLKEGHHALQLILQILQLTSDTAYKLRLLNEDCAQLSQWSMDGTFSGTNNSMLHRVTCLA